MIDLRDYFDILIRRWRIVVVMPALAAIAAALVTLTLKPMYEATATIALSPATISVLISTQQPPYYLLVDSPRRLPTAYTPAYYVALLKSAEVADAVSPRLAVSIAPNGADKSLIEITARGDDPQTVARVANAWAQAGARQIEKLLTPTGAEVDLARQKLDAAEQALVQFARENGLNASDLTDERLSLPADKQGKLNRLLRARDVADSVLLEFERDYEREAILAATSTPPTPILAPVPTAPVAPQLAPNVASAAVAGLLLGVLGACALEFLSRRTARAG